MTRRTGLGRYGRIEDAAGDPLDSLVNLFDIGIVLAVAFLVAGLGVTLDQSSHRSPEHASSAHGIPAAQQTQPLPSLSSSAPPASGQGQPVGIVYRLANGRLLYVRK